MKLLLSRRLMTVSSLAMSFVACSGEDPSTSGGSGGSSGVGGSVVTSSGGASTGGVTNTIGRGGASAGGSTSAGGVSTDVGGASTEVGGATMGIGGAATGGSKAAGGATTGGSKATGGAATGGSKATGGTATGGAKATGGAATGGSKATGGAGSGQSGSGGASGATTGGANAGGTAGTGAIPVGNDPVPSEGCGKATTVTNGKKTISSGGQDRTYIIDIPTNYDMSKPHRLFYTSHWIGSTSEAVRDQNYYFLKPLATAANVPAIFVAPQADGATWQQKDHALFDDILAFVKKNLCIDTTRVFATGFSFGGMITYSLSVNHQKDIRAGVGIAPANYNIWLPTKTHEPIAWMQTTGMGDGTCPWVNGTSTTQGAKYIAIEHATDNGCTIPTNLPTWQSGNHLCYDFQGCKAGFPVKACTFNGGHTNIANEGGTNWIPQESWKFFMQF